MNERKGKGSRNRGVRERKEVELRNTTKFLRRFEEKGELNRNDHDRTKQNKTKLIRRGGRERERKMEREREREREGEGEGEGEREGKREREKKKT